jgi:hypothetical protein
LDGDVCEAYREASIAMKQKWKVRVRLHSEDPAAWECLGWLYKFMQLNLSYDLPKKKCTHK